MTYAIISLGGKQYRVQTGQRLLVDRLPHADAHTFHPAVLFVGGDGKADFAPTGTQVTAKVVGSALGEKIRIGKYKKRTGYRRHTGHRSKLTQIEITAVGARTAARPKTEAPAAKPKPGSAKPAVAKAEAPRATKAAATKSKPAATKPKPAATAKPKAAKADPAGAKPKAPARAKPKPKASPTTTEKAE